MDLSTALFHYFLPEWSTNPDMSFGNQLSDAFNSQKIDLMKDGLGKLQLAKSWFTGFLYMVFASPVCQQQMLKFGEVFYEPERLIFTALGHQTEETNNNVIDVDEVKLNIFVFSLVENANVFPFIGVNTYEKMKLNTEHENGEHLVNDALSRTRFVTFKQVQKRRRTFRTEVQIMDVSNELQLSNIKSYRIEPNTAQNGYSTLSNLKSGAMSLHELIADLTSQIHKFPLPIEPAFVFAFLLGGMSNFLATLDLRISNIFRLGVVESVTFIAPETKGTMSIFGKPVRVQVQSSNVESDIEYSTEYLSINLVNIQVNPMFLVTHSVVEVDPFKPLFDHNVPTISRDEKTVFESLLTSHVARLKRFFGDRCVEHYFLGHFLAAQYNRGFVMRYHVEGANKPITSLMFVNSKRNAFVLNIAPPGALYDSTVSLEQVFLERIWRETLIEAHVFRVFSYNLEIAYRHVSFRSTEHGWISLSKEVIFSDLSNKFKGHLTFKERVISNNEHWKEPYTYSSGTILLMHNMFDVKEFLADDQIPLLNTQLTSVIGNIFYMAKVLQLNVEDVIQGQALVDPILSTKVHVYYPKLPIEHETAGRVTTSNIDMAVIRPVSPELRKKHMEEQLDELLPPTHRASKALLKSNVDQIQDVPNEESWMHFWHRISFLLADQQFHRKAQEAYDDYFNDYENIIGLPQKPKPEDVKITIFEPCSHSCYSQSLSVCSTQYD